MVPTPFFTGYVPRKRGLKGRDRGATKSLDMRELEG